MQFGNNLITQLCICTYMCIYVTTSRKFQKCSSGQRKHISKAYTQTNMIINLTLKCYVLLQYHTDKSENIMLSNKI